MNDGTGYGRLHCVGSYKDNYKIIANFSVIGGEQAIVLQDDGAGAYTAILSDTSSLQLQVIENYEVVKSEYLKFDITAEQSSFELTAIVENKKLTVIFNSSFLKNATLIKDYQLPVNEFDKVGLYATETGRFSNFKLYSYDV